MAVLAVDRSLLLEELLTRCVKLSALVLCITERGGFWLEEFLRCSVPLHLALLDDLAKIRIYFCNKLLLRGDQLTLAICFACDSVD